jgi:Protein of unknown function (DUF1778)
MHENEERNPMTSKTGSIGEFMTSTKRVVTDRAAAREASAHIIEQTQIIRLSVKDQSGLAEAILSPTERHRRCAAPFSVILS